MLIGAHRSRIISVEQYIRPKASDRVLDCGCGPAILLEYLPDVEYVGIDIDEKYIAQSRRRYGDRATFRLGPVGEETIQEEDHYDLVLAWGLLHHLDDDQATTFLRLARRCLKSTGRLVTADPCYTEDQSRVVRYLLDWDRGSHVRSLETWVELVRPVFPAVEAHVRHDLLHIPYTHVIMECPADDGAA
jgi:SAM-dependent methyltransferase